MILMVRHLLRNLRVTGDLVPLWFAVKKLSATAVSAAVVATKEFMLTYRGPVLLFKGLGLS